MKFKICQRVKSICGFLPGRIGKIVASGYARYDPYICYMVKLEQPENIAGQSHNYFWFGSKEIENMPKQRRNL